MSVDAEGELGVAFTGGITSIAILVLALTSEAVNSQSNKRYCVNVIVRLKPKAERTVKINKIRP